MDSEENVPIRNINFETPVRGTEDNNNPPPAGNDGDNVVSGSPHGAPATLLSPAVGGTRFTEYVIALLQKVVTGNDDAIRSGIVEFFKAFHITNEIGLSLLSDEDIPNGPPDTIWTSRVFIKAFMVIVRAAATRTFDGNTSFTDLLPPVRLSDDGSGISNNTSGSNNRFDLKAIQRMDLPEYSGETDKYIEWYESVERRFGTAGAQLLLKNVQLCTEYDDISFAAKCVVANSIENDSAAYLNTR